MGERRLGESGESLNTDAALPGDATRTVAQSSTSVTQLEKPRRGSQAADALERGQSVGRYIISDPLGSGGMGVVYKAYDPELNRGVALKVLHLEHRRDSSETNARARLEREAQALAQLSHPNVVAVHDVGRFDNDLFIAMELVEGQTLKDWRKAEPRSIEQILEVFTAAGRGLAAAHAVGLVHRDFKPDNVLIGKDGRVRVVDFGLARAAELEGKDIGSGVRDPGGGPSAFADFTPDFTTPAPASDTQSQSQSQSGSGSVPPYETPSEDDSGSEQRIGSLVSAQLTSAGAIVGTPPYMAPEQFLGEPVDAASDQFSFCVSLYEALYETRPFRGKDVAAIKRRVLAGRISAPPRNTKVPGWLRKILLRGLSSAADDRYPSMDALLAALHAVPAARRRRRGAIIAGLAAVAIAAPLLTFGSLSDDRGARCAEAGKPVTRVWSPAARNAIAAAFTESGVSHADDTARRVSELLDARAEDWGATRNRVCAATWIQGTQSEALLDLRMGCLDRRLNELTSLVSLLSADVDRDLVDRSVQAAFSLESVKDCAALTRADVEAFPPPATAEKRARLSALLQRLDELEVLRATGRYRKGAELGESLLADADALGHPPAQAEVLLLMGSLLDENGEFERASELLGRGLEIATVAGDHYRAAMMAAKRMWVIGYKQDRHDDALLLVPGARAAVARADNDPRALTELLASIGSIQFAKGDYEAARNSMTRRLELARRTRRPGDPRLASPLNSLGLVYVYLKDYPTAIDYLEQARGIREKALGADHPSLALTFTNLGIAYHGAGRNQDALQAFQRALASFEHNHGPDNPRVASALINVGEMFYRERRLLEAEAHFRRALAIIRARLGPDHQFLAMSLAGLGAVLNEQGRYAEAVELCQPALEIFAGKVGEENEHTGTAALCLGSALAGQGQRDKALGFLERALRILEGVKSEMAPEAQFALAQSLWQRPRDRTRARALAEGARAAWKSRANASRLAKKAEAWLADHPLE